MCNSFSSYLVCCVSVWFANSTWDSCIFLAFRIFFTFFIETEVLIKSVVYVGFILSQMNLALVFLKTHMLHDAFVHCLRLWRVLRIICVSLCLKPVLVHSCVYTVVIHVVLKPSKRHGQKMTKSVGQFAQTATWAEFWTKRQKIANRNLNFSFWCDGFQPIL